jgi:hypothetical protein
MNETIDPKSFTAELRRRYEERQRESEASFDDMFLGILEALIENVENHLGGDPGESGFALGRLIGHLRFSIQEGILHYRPQPGIHPDWERMEQEERKP